MLSFAHDSLEDLAQAHGISADGSDSTPEMSSLPRGCTERSFTIAQAAFLFSIITAVCATSVILWATGKLRVSWWHALWMGVRDRHSSYEPQTSKGMEERVAKLISHLFTAQMLMHLALIFLLFGLLATSFCVFSNDEWIWAVIVGIFLALTMFRYHVAMVVMKPLDLWFREN